MAGPVGFSSLSVAFTSPVTLAIQIRENPLGPDLDSMISVLKDANEMAEGSAKLNKVIALYDEATNPDEKRTAAALIAIVLKRDARLEHIVALAGKALLTGTSRFKDRGKFLAEVAATLKARGPVFIKADSIREDFDEAISDIRAVFIMRGNPLLAPRNFPESDFIYQEERKALNRMENYATAHPEFFEYKHIEMFQIEGTDLSMRILQNLKKSRPDLFK